jgi:hypothetical protein
MPIITCDKVTSALSNLVSSPSISFDFRRKQDPPRPTDQETEAYLRKSIPIAEGKPVKLWSLPDSSDKAPKISDIILFSNSQIMPIVTCDKVAQAYPRCPSIYDNGLSFDMDQRRMPLLYHHQPSSPDESPSLSSASSEPGTHFGHHNILMGPATGITGYSSAPYQLAQAFGQGLPSIAGQGFDSSRDPQSYESVRICYR